MKIIRGTVPCALKVCIYGPEGIGKSTFASRFPNPVFIDTEGSTAHMDLARTPRPQSFTALKEQIRYFIDHTEELDTLVIDTADWAERLLMEEICAQRKIKSIEDLGYGKGYTLLMEEFGKLLNLLDELLMRGVHVVFTAHAMMRKFEQPDELGQYDRWELKLQKKTAPLLKEWADLLLFANYKTTVVNVDNQGAAKGKNKAQGGRRVMYTTHHSCWDAKNRFGLADELPFEFEQIAGIMPPVAKLCDVRRQADAPEPVREPEAKPEPQAAARQTESDVSARTAPEPPKADEQAPYDAGESVPDAALLELMREAGVTAGQVRAAVAAAGYYPEATPIANYEPEFIRGCLVAAWDSVAAKIQEMDMPF